MGGYCIHGSWVELHTWIKRESTEKCMFHTAASAYTITLNDSFMSMIWQYGMTMSSSVIKLLEPPQRHTLELLHSSFLTCSWMGGMK